VNTIRLYLEGSRKREAIPFRIRRVVNAGYTSRNQEALRKHIEELRREGVPAPDSTPTAYEVITKLVYFDGEIEVIGERTSGEAEFVLLCSDKEVYVGVGSDHTDRELEVVSIIKSKQVCPNVMSRYVWRLKNIRKDWETLILRGWTEDEGGRKVLYQETPLGQVMDPEDLMAFVREQSDDKNLDGVVIFSGTIPILTGKTLCGKYFEVELHNPRTRRKLSCAYRVKVLDYLKG
jgi:hypothetical protein